VRLGGAYCSCLRSREGQDYWSTGVYREIEPPERLVFTDSFADEQGNVVPATYYGMNADYPLEMLVTATFEELDGQARLTLKHAGLPPGEDLDNCRVGWSESFDKLVEALAKG